MVARRQAIGWLAQFMGPGMEVARQIDGHEAHLLLATHLRIPHAYLEKIDVMQAPMEEDEEDRLLPPTNYACTLAGELQMLAYVGADRLFHGPQSLECVDRLIGLLSRLTPAQSMALHVMMDAAVIGFVGTISYASNWWHPPMLIRILLNPELDRLHHHI
jgi:hypothetical protein